MTTPTPEAPATTLPPLTQSLITKGLRSPRHLQHAMLYPDERETPATRLGTAIHMAALQPAKFEERYCLRPLGLDLRTKEGKAWAAANAGITALTAEEHASVRGCVATLNALGVDVFVRHASHIESRLHWNIDGVACSGQPDLIAPDGHGRATIIDIKTTRDASTMARSVYQFGYHRQDWWYQYGLSAALGLEPLDVLFFCVEPEPPYAGIVIELDDEWLEPASQDCMRAVEWVKRYKDEAEWPAYGDWMLHLPMPAWVKAAGSTDFEYGIEEANDDAE